MNKENFAELVESIKQAGDIKRGERTRCHLDGCDAFSEVDGTINSTDKGATMNRILKIAAIVATTSLCAFAAEEKQATCPRQGSGGQAVTQGGGKSTVRARMSQDVAVYGRDGIREIERLYRAYASKAENAEEALKLLIEKYPKANRTGCAVMYAAQQTASMGMERKWVHTRDGSLQGNTCARATRPPPRSSMRRYGPSIPMPSRTKASGSPISCPSQTPTDVIGRCQ